MLRATIFNLLVMVYLVYTPHCYWLLILTYGGAAGKCGAMMGVGTWVLTVASRV